MGFKRDNIFEMARIWGFMRIWSLSAGLQAPEAIFTGGKRVIVLLVWALSTMRVNVTKIGQSSRFKNVKMALEREFPAFVRHYVMTANFHICNIKSKIISGWKVAENNSDHSVLIIFGRIFGLSGCYTRQYFWNGPFFFMFYANLVGFSRAAYPENHIYR